LFSVDLRIENWICLPETTHFEFAHKEKVAFDLFVFP
jgi:hypothetical protein